MSTCTSAISPGTDRHPIEQSLLPGSGASPAQATSVPSHLCAVSPQEASAEQLKARPAFFNSTMANEAATEVEMAHFESLVSWYFQKNRKDCDQKTPQGSTINQPNQSDQTGRSDWSDRKRKNKNLDANESLSPKRLKEENFDSSLSSGLNGSLIEQSAKVEPNSGSEDNPLRRMEMMTNSSVFDATGLTDVVTSSATAKAKEAERERNAKLQALGEIENSLCGGSQAPSSNIRTEPSIIAPDVGMKAWERLVGHTAPSTSSALPQHGGPQSVPTTGAACASGHNSPMFPPSYPPTGPLSAGAYPPPPAGFPQMAGPVPPGAINLHAQKLEHQRLMHARMMQGIPPMQPGFPQYNPQFPAPPFPGCRPGMPPLPPNHPMYLSFMAQSQAAAAKAAGMSPGAYPMPAPPATGIPPGYPGMPPFGPGMMPPGRFPQAQLSPHQPGGPGFPGYFPSGMIPPQFSGHMPQGMHPSMMQGMRPPMEAAQMMSPHQTGFATSMAGGPPLLPQQLAAGPMHFPMPGGLGSEMQHLVNPMMPAGISPAGIPDSTSANPTPNPMTPVMDPNSSVMTNS